MKLMLCFIKSVTVFLTIILIAINANFLHLFAIKSRDSPENCFPRQCATNLCQLKLVARTLLLDAPQQESAQVCRSKHIVQYTVQTILQSVVHRECEKST